jgi:multisubunit Na+/H+ antiporter MnhB subunit
MSLQLVSIPTEQTTAITDLILAVQSVICIYLVRSRSTKPCLALSLWIWVFGLLAFSSFLGAFVHGFELAAPTLQFLWGPLYFALGLLVSLVALAAIAHSGREEISKRLLPASFGLAFIFSVITQMWSDSFLLFVAYEAIMMTVALTVYLACLWRSDPWGSSGLLALGVLLTLIAAAVDTQSTWRLQFIWLFDNHGLFHLIQMVGLSIISVGVNRSRESMTDTGTRRCQTMT